MPREPLTAQECEILRRAARGEYARESAVEMGLAGTYVRQLRMEVLRKLGARNVAQAVAIGYEEAGIAEATRSPAS